MTSNPRTIQYLEPTQPRTPGVLVVPAVRGLRGKTIAFLDNGWSSFTRIGARMDRVLRERYGVAELRRYSIASSSAVPADLLDRIASECDAAIVGMAN